MVDFESWTMFLSKTLVLIMKTKLKITFAEEANSMLKNNLFLKQMQ
jgi:hypothetical protein